MFIKQKVINIFNIIYIIAVEKTYLITNSFNYLILSLYLLGFLRITIMS